MSWIRKSLKYIRAQYRYRIIAFTKKIQASTDERLHTLRLKRVYTPAIKARLIQEYRLVSAGKANLSRKDRERVTATVQLLLKKKILTPDML